MDEILAPIAKPMAWLLSLFYAVIPNLGIAIILVTFTIMLLLYPLTAKQARSMIAMQMVQPEIKRIQAKYKNDRAKLNEEMMAFYQENKINPLAGCLPLLIQMPIFFALFRVLQRPDEVHPRELEALRRVLHHEAGRGGRRQAVQRRRVATSTCRTTRSSSGSTCRSRHRTRSARGPRWRPSPWSSLVMFTGYVQSRQAQKRTPAVNKQMALITKVMPVFFGFISLNFPSGLVLYFFVSNTWRLGQQEVIFRRIGTAANPKHKSLMNPPKAGVVDAESRERGSVDVIDEPAELESGETTPKATGKPTPKAAPKGGTSKSGGSLGSEREEHQREVRGHSGGSAASGRGRQPSLLVPVASPARERHRSRFRRRPSRRACPRRSRQARRIGELIPPVHVPAKLVVGRARRRKSADEVDRWSG